jgi:hypothetical protein
MLPRLRFVIASIAIAILPMVFLGSGAVPAPPSHAAFTPADAKSALAGRTLPREPRVTNETQYRYERHAMSFTRRSEELSRLRELASLSVNDWAAAPAGAAPAEPQAGESEAAAAPEKQSAPENPPAAALPVAVSAAALSPAVPASPAPALAPERAGPAATIAAASEAAAPPAAPSPAEDASASNKPAAEKTAADNPPAPATYAALTLDNDIKTADTPKIEAGASRLTQVVVVASRKKPKKVHRAAVHRRAVRPAARAPQPPPPAGPFAFFSWLFGQQPGQAPPQTQTQVQPPARAQPQKHAAAPFSKPPARTAAR